MIDHIGRNDQIWRLHSVVGMEMDMSKDHIDILVSDYDSKLERVLKKSTTMKVSRVFVPSRK